MHNRRLSQLKIEMFIVSHHSHHFSPLQIKKQFHIVLPWVILSCLGSFATKLLSVSKGEKCFTYSDLYVTFFHQFKAFKCLIKFTSVIVMSIVPA